MMMTDPIPIVVLAAGESRRLGSAKQLVRFAGQTLLARAIATGLAARSGPILVVLGSRLELLRDEVTALGARVIVNSAWATGMGSSVRAAVATVEADLPAASAILFTVCDQPLVTPELLAAIIRTHRAGADLVAASYAGGVGVPALFARRCFAELRDLPGDAGARRVLARHAEDVVAVPFPDGIVDVDTPADTDRLADLDRRS